MNDQISNNSTEETPVVVFDDSAVTLFPEDDDPSTLVGEEVPTPRGILLPEFSDVDPPTSPGTAGGA